MKRMFTFAATATLVASIGSYAWSQAGQSGGAGAGTSGSSGTSGASGASASGTAGSAAGAANRTQAGAAGAGANTGAAAGAGVNRSGANASAQSQAAANWNRINQTPFFSDPGARQQLGLSEQQYNQLNQAYQRAYQRYSQDLEGAFPKTVQTDRGQGTSTAAAQRAQRLRDFQNRTGANQATGTQMAAEQRAARLREFQTRFDNDFNTAVNDTLTDPAMRQRFNQLRMQYQGLNAFTDPRIQQQLNLTAAQQRQLRQLAGQYRRDLNNVRRDGRTEPEQIQQQFSTLQSQYLNQATGLLTPAQQQQWNQLVGDAYNFPYTAYYPNVPYNRQGQAQSAQAPQRQQQDGRPTNVPQTGSAEGQQGSRVR